MNVKANKELSIDLGSQFQSAEDPRLFIFRGSPWMAFIASSWPAKAPTSVIRYGRLVQVGADWQIEDSFQIQYGKNDGYHLEKNWVPFEYSNSLYFIYASSPEQIIIEVDGNKVLGEHRSPAPRWPWGQIRGGTSPLPYQGKLLRFFHSSLDFELPPNHRRYFMGAALMNPEPPFETVAVSKEPIAIGSELDDLSETERSQCMSHKMKVVFPAGAVVHEDGFLVSAGINDCCSVLLKVKEKDLKL